MPVRSTSTVSPSPKPLTLDDLSQLVGLTILRQSSDHTFGNLSTTKVIGICSAFSPKPQHIAYLTQAKDINKVDQHALDYLIVPSNTELTPRNKDATLLFAHPNPRLAIAKLAAHFEPCRPWQRSGSTLDMPSTSPTIHPTAFCHPGSVIAAAVNIGVECYIGPNVTIEAGVSIGNRTVIQGNAYIGDRVEIGDDCWIHPGAVIGSEGFGLVPSDDPATRVWQRVPHLGTVIIGNRVEIGANTTIDRGAIDDTIIADDVILDNQIQVAHNVRIGRGTAMAGCVGIAGSATIGSGCLVGGGSGIAGHLSIGDNTMVNGMSFVSRDLPSGGHYASGFPVLPTKQWNKLVATMRRLIKKTG